MSCFSSTAARTGARQNVILLVEDDELVRDLAAELLQDGGYSVIQAADAQEAMRIIEDQRGLDLVFSDVRMPGPVDGIGLAKWIMRFHPQLAVVLASGYADPKSLQEAAHVDAIMQKPYAGEDVIRRLGMVLASRRKSDVERPVRSSAGVDESRRRH